MSIAAWREAARRVLGSHGERTAIDTSGLAIPQVALVARLTGGRYEFAGTVTNRCHSCGELITKPWECLFVDDTPGAEWASSIEPPRVTARTTTHHASHMAA
jgi:hypothetical protein